MNIYFAGIGGVGIGPLAEIALDAGYTVVGSDPVEGLMTGELRNRGVTICNTQDGDFLRRSHASQPIDRVVYSASLSTDHPELAAARALGIPTMKRDALLAELIALKNLKLIAVTGTHGKTTTTGMLIWCFEQLGIPVSYSVGTTLSFGPSGKYTPGSKYFLYECDEFDRNFLHFQPHLSIVTSIDYDHPDTYPTQELYKEAFRDFLRQSGASILWEADAEHIELVESNAWRLQPGEQLPLAIPGEHNRRNATLVVKAFERLAIPMDHAVIEQFPGTNRRFERLADNLYSDYGHHPVEIAATLQLARELSDHVVLVYQPHQNVRQHELQGLYTDAVVKDAEEIYWLPTYLSRENPALPILTPQELTTALPGTRNLHYAQLDDALWQAIEEARAKGKLVLCMGAGSIDAWVRDHLRN